MIISPEESIITFIGGDPGPTTTIMVGVHGNERSGPLAVLELLEEGFSPDRGIVHFIFANLQALETNVRYVEVNMNRCFGQISLGYEAQRVQDVIPYLQQSDYLLDIHNTIDLSTPPFIICEHDELLPYFDVSWCVRGLDELHPGGSDGYMNSIGKKAVCLEVGSIADDLEMTIRIAKNHIKNFLAGVKNIHQEAVMYQFPSVLSCRSIYHAKFGAFELIRLFAEFESVSKGVLLGTDGEISVFMQEDGFLLFSRNTHEIGDECFVVVN